MKITRGSYIIAKYPCIQPLIIKHARAASHSSTASTNIYMRDLYIHLLLDFGLHLYTMAIMMRTMKKTEQYNTTFVFIKPMDALTIVLTETVPV